MNRTLTTPTEEDWPGVTSMPDYKPTFPSWKTNSLAQSVKQMDNTGLDLLQVIVTVFRFNNKSDCFTHRCLIGKYISHYLAHLAKGIVSFCHHLASVVR
jgi:hypothetical protein